MKIIVTGGAGFIGSALIRFLIRETDHVVVNADKLTYAANLASLAAVENSPRYRFKRVDICDRSAVDALFRRERPDAVMHLAAESHVDRSIDGAAAFIQTNIVGTYNLLESARLYWSTLPPERAEQFCVHHISTDEVFGSLGETGLFTEESQYQPNSPYAASKASSDQLVRAWHRTYGLPVLLSNCSNTYGPFQFPEKLIPLTILNSLHRKPISVYGAGQNVRDWLFVDDHVNALYTVLLDGCIGERYNIGGRNERRNLEVVEKVCDLVDELLSRASHDSRQLITFVADRPGHDYRYAMDCFKVERELGWRPTVDFEEGLRTTVRWYLDNTGWWQPLLKERYKGERLGVLKTGMAMRRSSA